MKIFPYEHLRIHTALGKEEVLKKLDKTIDQHYSFFFSRDHLKMYRGNLIGLYFKISPIVYYRNFSLPVIIGEVQTELSGCSIWITMRPEKLSLFFMLFWFGITGSIFIASLILFFSPSIHSIFNNGIDILRMTGMMFIIGYLLVFISFKYESIQSKKYFRELFQAEDVEELGFPNPFKKRIIR